MIFELMNSEISKTKKKCKKVYRVGMVTYNAINLENKTLLRLERLSYHAIIEVYEIPTIVGTIIHKAVFKAFASGLKKNTKSVKVKSENKKEKCYWRG